MQFNQSSMSVTGIRHAQKGRVGWRFACYSCNVEKKYLDEYFTNPYGAAVASLRQHRC